MTYEDDDYYCNHGVDLDTHCDDCDRALGVGKYRRSAKPAAPVDTGASDGAVSD